MPKQKGVPHRLQPIAMTMTDGSFIAYYWVLDPILWIEGVLVPVDREVDASAIQRDIDKTLWTDADGNKITCASWRLIDVTDLPADRYFRGAWKDTGRIEVDMPRAREIHREKLRRKRIPILAALDTEYMKADEANDPQAKKRIAAQKQALRDVTADPRIDVAQTPEELKAVIPDVLRG